MRIFISCVSLLLYVVLSTWVFGTGVSRAVNARGALGGVEGDDGALALVNSALADGLVSHEFSQLDKRERMSRYHAGLGACGRYHTDNDDVVAMSALHWDGGAHCFKRLRIHYGGRSIVAMVVDRCGECTYNGLDLSDGLYRKFDNPDNGIFDGQWEWVDDSPTPTSRTTTTREATTTARESRTTSAETETSSSASATSAAPSNTSTTETELLGNLAALNVFWGSLGSLVVQSVLVQRA